MKQLHRKLFEKWLEKHQGDVFVGSDPDRCPLAKYTGERISPSWRYFYKTDGSEFYQYKLPAWAKKFIKRVDVHNKVGGETALVILRSIE